MKGIKYDANLTTFAHGIAPDLASALAELMAPQCIAPAASGQYIAFDDDDMFRYIETRRPIGGDMAMIEMPAESPRFSCDPHALGIGTDAFEFERVGDAGETQLRESKVRTLVSRNAISREQRVFRAYADGVTAEVGGGDWVDPDVDPISELNQIIAGVCVATGRRDIVLVIGLNALLQADKHPKVRARMGGVTIESLTPALLAKMLTFPVRIEIAMLPVVLEKVGKAGNKTVIGGDQVYALLTQKTPSPFDPSAAKTFTTRRGQVDGVGYVEKPPFAEVNFLAWSEDIKLTGAKCVKRLNVTVGDMEE